MNTSRLTPVVVRICVVAVVIVGAGYLGTLALSSDAPVQAQAEATAPPPPPPPAPETLDIVGVVPLPNTPLRSEVVFFFDDALEPIADGDLARLVKRNPDIGTAIIIRDNYIAFDVPRRDGEWLLDVELNPQIRSVRGHTLNPEKTKFSFANFIYDVRRVYVTNQSVSTLELGILLPAPTTPEAVSSHVVVRDADGMEITGYTLSQGSQPGLVILPLATAVKLPVRLEFSPGLTSANGSLQLTRRQIFRYPVEEALTLNDVNWGEIERDAQEIVVDFSHEVVPADVQQQLTIAHREGGANVPYTVKTEEASSSQVLEVNLPTPLDVELSVTVKAGLKGPDGVVLREDAVRYIAEHPQPLIIEYGWLDRDWEHPENGMVFRFGLNQQVSFQDLAKHIEFEPPLEGMRIEPEDSTSFAIYGEWRGKQQYMMKVTPGLEYNYIKLTQPITYSIQTEEIPEYVGFGHEGKFYFPRRPGMALNLQSRNVDTAKVTLFRMFPSNIAVSLEDMAEGQSGYNFNRNWAEELITKEFDVPSSGDKTSTTPVDVNALFPEGKKGVFSFQVSAEDAGSSYKLAILTDIGILAHWSNDELVVFAHNLYSLEPLSAAQVTAYSSKNQILGSAATDARGTAHLGKFDTSLGDPRVIVVEKGDDFSFLELEARDDSIGQTTGNLPAYDRETYDAFIYADRELYRPGEPVHLRWIVRKEYGAAVSDVPLLLKIYKPNGRELLSQSTTLSALGTGGLDLQTEKDYPTGAYTVDLYVPGTSRGLGSYSFRLEEFVPNRIKAEVKIADAYWEAGKDHQITVEAQHLFGAPASGRNVEASVVLQQGGMKSEAWKEYRFVNDDEFVSETISLGESTTDENGQATFTFHYRVPANITTPLTAVVVAEVFELGGRAIVARSTTPLYPAESSLGIATSAAQADGALEVNVAAVRPDGSASSLSTVKVSLERQVWNYYVRRYYSHYQPNWADTFEVVETRDVPLTGGKGSTAFNVSGYGHYRVRVHSEQTQQYSTASFYAYDGQYNVVDSAKPSLIKLRLDKVSYAPGEEAMVTIESPFDGRGFAVIQGEDFRALQVVEIRDNIGRLRVPVTRDMFPNAWVEVTVVHGVTEGRAQVYPFSSFELANIKVDDPEKKLEVSFVSMPEEIRPLQHMTVNVQTQTSGGAGVASEVVIAAVDEGIHSITDYKTPDPYAWLSRSRQPEHRRAHYYDKVEYDFDKPAAGGDGTDDLLSKRAATVGENWIRPVALWLGVVQTNADGVAQVMFNVPEFTGQLRFVAVACTPTALGATDENVYVRRPHMLQTSMPRFLLPGDTAQCRGVLYNTTDEAARATVTWTMTGALSGAGGEASVDLPAKGEGSFLAEIVAGDTIGQGELQWEAVIVNAAGEELSRLTEKAPIPVRPPGAFQSNFELSAIQPGQKKEVRNTVFLENEMTEVSIVASANPLVRLSKALEYVIGYPYGCVEQTTSKLMPLYLLKQQAALLTTDGTQTVNPKALDSMIDAGIQRLFAMQTSSGGLGFWPGSDYPSEYGSTYGLHFLTLVKKGRQYELPEANFNALQEYVRQIAMDWSDVNSHSRYLRAYATYVLALDGDIRALRQIERFDSLELSRAARYLLAAALAQNTTDSARIKLYLSKEPFLEGDVTEQDAAFASDIRNTAVELIALVQMKADQKEIAHRAEKLIQWLEANHHGNTHESALAITALSDYLATIADTIAGAAMRIDGPDGTSTIQGKEVFKANAQGPGNVFMIENTGTAPIYVYATTRGIPTEAPQEATAEGLMVSRTFYDDQGNEIEEGAFGQMSSYVVGLTIQPEQPVTYLVVADLLPAGFEIENPRLSGDTGTAAMFDDATEPSYLDIRDDRLVIAYDYLAYGENKFYYIVRAVTPGTYQYPPLSAECMYNEAVHARTLPHEATVGE